MSEFQKPEELFIKQTPGTRETQKPVGENYHLRLNKILEVFQTANRPLAPKEIWQELVKKNSQHFKDINALYSFLHTAAYRKDITKSVVAVTGKNRNVYEYSAP